jgi:hypothetical protein
MTGVEGRSEGKRRITIREAATLLKVHPNTVRNRIKDGSLDAEKVVTERGPTWMIDPDSLTTNAPTSDSQQLVGRVPEEALTLLAREIVREAGLHPDPEREAKLEGNKLEAESAKTQILISSGLLVAMAAVVGVLPTTVRMEWLFTSFILVLTSVIAGISQMRAISREVARQGSTRRVGSWIPLATLGMGVIVFMLFAASNLPGSELTTRDIVESLLGATLLTGVFFGAGLLLRWYRRRSRENDR